MAVLSQTDLKWCVNWIRDHPTHKANLKASGLTKTQLYAALQAIEDYIVGSYTTIPTQTLRSAINAATGSTPTTPQNQTMWYALSAWRSNQ